MIKAELAEVEPANLEVKASGAGVVDWMWSAPPAAEGDDGAEPVVPAGEALVKLRGFKGVERKVATLSKAVAKLQDEYDRAQADGNKNKVAALEKRLEPKRKQLEDAQESLRAFVVAAPKDGAFTPSVKVRDKVTAETVLGMVTGKAKRTADFKVSDAASWSEGDEITVVLEADPKKSASCSIIGIGEGMLTVDCGGALEAGPVVFTPPETPTP